MEVELLFNLSSVSSIEDLIDCLSAADPAEVESFDRIRRLLNRRDESRVTKLHHAIILRSIKAVKLLIAFGADANLKCHGTPPLHLVIASGALPDGKIFAQEALQLLLASADLMARDDQGLTAFHVAAEIDNVEFLKVLFDKAENASLLEIKDRIGFRPLHRAVNSGAQNAVAFLVAKDVSLSAQTPFGLTPLHIAAAGGLLGIWNTLVAAGADLGIRDRLGRTASEYAAVHGWSPSITTASAVVDASIGYKGTAVLSHPLCVKHFTCAPSETDGSSAPPENLNRLKVIIDERIGVLRSEEMDRFLQWVPACRPAAISDVLRVHEWAYVKNLDYTCSRLPVDADGDGGIGSLDGDTTVSRLSFQAALHAAGAGTEAVDMVLKNQVKNAFCAVRPPGHHAGPRGLVRSSDEGPDSHGFCLLNNISIAAAYALNVYRDKVKRVAIIDFDVHHGNGTEETVRWLKPGLETAQVVTPLCFGTVQTPLYKPWCTEKDADNVLFVSVHGYGVRQRGLEEFMPQAAFYPGTGQTVIPDVPDSVPDSLSGTVHSSVFGPNERKQLPIKTGDSSAEEPMDVVRQNVPSQYAQDGNEDDDDDDDEDYQDDEDDEEDDDEEDGRAESGSAAFLGSDRVAELQQMYRSGLSAPVGVQKGDLSDPLLSSMSRSLILDIGVSLPAEHSERSAADEVGETDPSIAAVLAAAGVSLAQDDEEEKWMNYRYQWRSYFREQIFPRLIKFKPDLVFISAGFDAHRKDTINAGYLALVEEDFDWVTDRLVQIANTSCEGRVVSALEGGYQIGGAFCSSFAKSVKAHVGALCRGARSKAKYSASDAEIEASVELELLTEAAAVRRAKRQQMALELVERRRREEEDEERRRASDLASGASSAPNAPTDEVAASASTVESSAVEASSRKRRRAQVDYVALDKEMREQKNINS